MATRHQSSPDIISLWRSRVGADNWHQNKPKFALAQRATSTRTTVAISPSYYATCKRAHALEPPTFNQYTPHSNQHMSSTAHSKPHFSTLARLNRPPLPPHQPVSIPNQRSAQRRTRLIGSASRHNVAAPGRHSHQLQTHPPHNAIEVELPGGWHNQKSKGTLLNERRCHETRPPFHPRKQSSILSGQLYDPDALDAARGHPLLHLHIQLVFTVEE